MIQRVTHLRLLLGFYTYFVYLVSENLGTPAHTDSMPGLDLHQLDSGINNNMYVMVACIIIFL